MLSVYLVLLIGVPSYVTIGPLGSLGRPSLIWGLILMFWWLLAQLQARARDTRPVSQVVRFALAAFCVVVLVSFAAAMLRGQPADQISPATTALVRLASWAGVLLVTMDGVRTQSDAVKLVRRIVILGGGLAALGLAQFISGQTLLDWVSAIPGLSVDAGDVATRGAYTRASGTATHPLEYGTVLAASFPLAVVVAVNSGFTSPRSRHAAWWWLPVGLLAAASLVAVSRSAIIGFAVALIATLPALPRLARWAVGIGGAALSVVVLALVPGMFGTLVGLFAGASDDPSTQSRTNALARVPEFLASSPIVGQGFGIFLPRYYIFDNAWVLLTIETGVLGICAFMLMITGAVGSAVWASRVSPHGDTRALSIALAAAVLTSAVLLLFFDGLSFSMSAGLLFLLAGMTAAMRTIAAADAASVPLSGSSPHRAAKPRSAPTA